MQTAARKGRVREAKFNRIGHTDYGARPAATSIRFGCGTRRDEASRCRPVTESLLVVLADIDILIGDLKRAGIERKDGLGRVVHCRSFRKTVQSLGVRNGINQRAA
jgi:hypothetical protein